MDFFPRVLASATALGSSFDLDESGDFGWLAGSILILRDRFPLNTALAARAASDKWITKILLRRGGVETPDGRCVSRSGVWDGLFEAFEWLGRDVIVKPRTGERGSLVFRCRTLGEVAYAASRVFARFPSLVLEKLVLGREFRVLVLDGNPLVCVERTHLVIWGDGRSSAEDLLSSAVPDLKGAARDPRLAVGAGGVPLDRILARGEKWRPFPSANSPGAGARAVDTDLVRSVVSSALTATRAVGLRLAGVDLIWNSDSKTAPVVLEVNSAPAIESGVAPPNDEAMEVEICCRVLEACLASSVGNDGWLKRAFP